VVQAGLAVEVVAVLVVAQVAVVHLVELVEMALYFYITKKEK
jgi:hypothetical protein